MESVVVLVELVVSALVVLFCAAIDLLVAVLVTEVPVRLLSRLLSESSELSELEYWLSSVLRLASAFEVSLVVAVVVAGEARATLAGAAAAAGADVVGGAGVEAPAAVAGVREGVEVEAPFVFFWCSGRSSVSGAIGIEDACLAVGSGLAWPPAESNGALAGVAGIRFRASSSSPLSTMIGQPPPLLLLPLPPPPPPPTGHALPPPRVWVPAPEKGITCGLTSVSFFFL